MARIEDDDDLPVSTSTQPRSDAYTGMLVISLAAMITGCALLYLDYSEYPGNKPPNPSPPAKVDLAPSPAPAAPPAAK